MPELFLRCKRIVMLYDMKGGERIIWHEEII